MIITMGKGKMSITLTKASRILLRLGFILILGICMMILGGLMPVQAAGSVSFLDYDEHGVATVKTYTESEYKEFNSSTTTLTNGIWVVSESMTVNTRINISGNYVRLVIKDGVILNLPAGIRLVTENDNRLYVYGQSEGTGRLIAGKNAADMCAGIGGNANEQCGTLNVHGVNVEAYGGKGAAGIGGGRGGKGQGGGFYSFAGYTLARGGVKYTDGGGAGIGGGSSGEGGYTVIYGGTVEAHGGSQASGIGGGAFDDRGQFRMYNGKVLAYGGYGAAGIGSGRTGYGSLYVFYIYDGEIYAQGDGGGAGIGGGEGSTGISTPYIYGGHIVAVAGSEALGAWGHGKEEWLNDNTGDGTITFDPSCVVKAGSDAKSASIVVTNDSNVKQAACFSNKYVDISICDHSDRSFSFNGDVYTHDWVCNICGTKGTEGHVMGEDGKCVCGIDTGAVWVRDEEGCYLIYNENHWNLFCEMCGVTSTVGKKFRLMNDISVSRSFGDKLNSLPGDYAMWLTPPNTIFFGEFDGGGHTLDFNPTGNTPSGSIAPFLVVSKCTIKNLHVTGKIQLSGGEGDYCGGLIARSHYERSIITNVRVSTEISFTGDGARVGGFIGNKKSSYLDPDVFTGCVFDGKIATDSGNVIGGFVCGEDIGSRASFTECLFAPSEVSGGNSSSSSFAANAATTAMSNGYYSELLGENPDSRAVRVYSITCDNTHASISTAYSVDVSYDTSLYTRYKDDVFLRCGNAFYSPEGKSITLSILYDGTEDRKMAVWLNGSSADLAKNNNNGTYTFTVPSNNVKLVLKPSKQYTVTLLRDDGTVIQEREYEYGAMPSLPADPDKPNSGHTGYVFVRWDRPAEAVTDDTTYTAYFKPTESDSHVWTYSRKWSEDGKVTLIATCVADPNAPHEESETIQAHYRDDWGLKNCCLEYGNRIYYYTLSDFPEGGMFNGNKDITPQTSSYNFLEHGEHTVEKAAPPLGHDWGEPSYMWIKNTNLGYADLQATVRCNNDFYNHTQTETVRAEKIVLEPATCEEKGLYYYYAVFENELFEPRSSEIYYSAATGHKWGEPEYELSEDGKTLTARIVCQNDRSHIKEEETVNVTSVISKDPTCTENGETTYTSAAFESSSFEQQTITLADIPALGHDWGEPVYTWADDNSSVTAVHTCKRDPSHTESETEAALSEITKAAECEVPGEMTYTSVVFENEAFDQQVKREDIPATGHDWGEPTYTWSEDHSSVTARRVCGNDPDHVEKEMVVAKSVGSEDATCTEAGWEKLESAEFENEAFAKQELTVTIPAQGHDWDETVYTWSDDLSSVTAMRVCKSDSAHIEKETVEATAVSTPPASCETGNLWIYASEAFDNNAFKRQVKMVEIPATGHNWGEPTYSWSEDNSKVTAKRICKNDRSHVETETVSTVLVDSKAATCEEAGWEKYASAEFKNEAFVKQEGKIVDIPALGHDWGEPVYVLRDSFPLGLQFMATRTCRHDSSHYEVENVRATAEVTKEPTCDEKGETTYTSAEFSNKAFEKQVKTIADIPALGHTLVKTGYHQETCTQEGNRLYYTCSVCGKYFNQYEKEIEEGSWIIPKASHDLERIDGKAPTCEEPGYYNYWRCRECHSLFEDSRGQMSIDNIIVIPALGHDWGEWEETKPATATEKGEETRTCKRDASHKETRDIPMLDAVLDSIEISGTFKTEYVEGDPFDPAGMIVTAKYTDGTGKVLSTGEYTISPAGALTTSDTGVTISCTEGGVTKTVTQTITVNANTYTVTFDPNGGSVKPTSGMTGTDGKLASLPTPDTRTDYAFDGWFTAASGGSKVDETTVFTEDATVFAHWTYTGGSSGGGGGGGIVTQYTLTYDTNGGSEVAATKHNENTTVDLTAAPTKEGFTFDGWYADAALTSKITSIKMDGNKTVYAGWKEDGSVTPGHDCPSKHLKDVDVNAWYHEYVDYVVVKDLMQGVAADQFAPNAATSRAMIVTILYRLESSPQVSGKADFDDVAAGSWYSDAVEWAEENDIVNGYSETKFGPNDLLTREQLAAIMYRYANFKGCDTSEEVDLAAYADASDISEWAESAMKWANAESLITGRTATTLVPRGNVTRAEVATILKRFIENVM